uniref:Four helix bundle protein n=1 Tax=Roseihalotalea indica TaxID=2867963 RepID=A0AA49GUM7_9BACT|nr:four helix bundle protein [Tunicatimonas sp. TK19036]
MVKRFEDREVWQESFNLSVVLYKLLSECKDFGLRDQMQRSAVSIPSNIAEGFERSMNKEFIHYLHIAKGSCAELRTQLYIAQEIKTLDIENTDEMIEQTRKISAMLYKLIQTRKNKF